METGRKNLLTNISLGTGAVALSGLLIWGGIGIFTPPVTEATSADSVSIVGDGAAEVEPTEPKPYVNGLAAEDEAEAAANLAAQEAAAAQAAADAAAAQAAADAAAAQAAADSQRAAEAAPPVKCAPGTTAGQVDGAGNESNCQATNDGQPCVEYNDANQCVAWYKP